MTARDWDVGIGSMNNGGGSRARGKGRASPPPSDTPTGTPLHPSRLAGANVTIAPTTPTGGSVRKGAHHKGWATQGPPWGIPTLILVAIALQMLILVRLGTHELLPTVLRPFWQSTESAGEDSTSDWHPHTMLTTKKPSRHRVLLHRYAAFRGTDDGVLIRGGTLSTGAAMLTMMPPQFASPKVCRRADHRVLVHLP